MFFRKLQDNIRTGFNYGKKILSQAPKFISKALDTTKKITGGLNKAVEKSKQVNKVLQDNKVIDKDPFDQTYNIINRINKTNDTIQRVGEGLLREVF